MYVCNYVTIIVVSFIYIYIYLLNEAISKNDFVVIYLNCSRMHFYNSICNIFSMYDQGWTKLMKILTSYS